MSRHAASSHFHKSKTLNDKYMLGDEIGKGAYGRVYKGLDLENGDFVAIKQVSLENIAQEDLNIIMQEIDLLKNLNHKNIVKYLGSFKTKTHLYIILEYVENGSLASIIKPNKFGPFPESLVAVYIAQVLEGLVYLHEQGVIHRDIKGANILSTKEGLVKLADFGVATKLTEADVNTHSVVGTPYWMAPEVIEMSGVSAASDIWSVGCTVIELLTCVPPYYDLQPMPALFRIVSDEQPPIPDRLSPGITDFLHQCFRKDAMQRPDAKKLLMHPWIRNSRRALHSSLQRTGARIRSIPQDVSTVVRTIEDGDKGDEDSGERKLKKEDIDTEGHPNGMSQIEVVQFGGSFQHQNEKAEGSYSLHEADSKLSAGDAKDDLLPDQDSSATFLENTSTKSSSGRMSSKGEEALIYAADSTEPSLRSPVNLNEGLLNDMVSPESKRKNVATLHELPENGRAIGPVGNGSAIHGDNNIFGFEQRVQEPRFQKASKSSVLSGVNELGRFSDTPADSSLDDLFQEPMDRIPEDHAAEASTSAPSSHLGQNNLQFYDASKNDLAAKLKAKMAQKRKDNEIGQRNGGDLLTLMMGVFREDEIGIDGLGFEDRIPGENLFPIQAIEFSKLVGSLKPEEPEDVIVSACQKLLVLFHEHPEQKIVFISQHGLLPLMELLDLPKNRVICSALQIVNQIIKDNTDFQENACLVGLIPVVMNFAVPERPREVRMQAAYFLQQLCQTSSLTLQMFIACRGIPVLVGFLEADYAKYREMVHLAIDAMWQVFKLQCSTPRNDFCRISAKNGILIRLVNTLHSLNEATRLASTPGGNGSLATDGPAPRPRSGPLDASCPVSLYPELPAPRDLLEPPKSRIPLSIAAAEPSRASTSQPHRSDANQPESRLISGDMEKPRSAYSLSESGLLSKTSDPSFLESVGSSTTKEPIPLLSKEREAFELRKSEASRSAENALLRQQRGPNTTNRVSLDMPHKQLDPLRTSNGTVGTSSALPSQNEQVQPLLSLLEKEPPSRHVSGQLEYIRHLSGGLDRPENILPLLHASTERKTNGELEFLMAAFAEVSAQGRENGNLESISRLSPKAYNRVNPQALASVVNEGVASSSGLASQTASGILSGSGVLNARAGSATSSGLLAQMASTLNADVAREYLEKVADLLLEFSQADTAVKSYMCSQSLLNRLFQMLKKIELPILLKILKCISNLSTDPNCLENLQRADAIKHLIPNLELHEGPLVAQIHTEVLNALYNLCKINKRRQEQAAENGIIPHLMRFIISNSPLKQYALPLLCDMAHASRNSREQLRAHGGLDVYLSLLDDEMWSVTALDSLAVCLAHDNDHKKVEQALLKKEAVQKLVKFFQCCPEPSFVHILEPFLKVITKSSRINTTLAVNGLTPLLIARLDHQDAIARLNLLKLIKAVYEHHPRPKQLIVENDLPQKLQNLIEERRDGERSGGQVLVKQMATALLKALHINTVL
ncbi:MAP3K epsilon protein kinase 1 isoform X1 [Amborella trichopoda]|nr:MAP3K epsilon protein kinase 1 isoform X1 [Amborella trichopoda]|eukprot:XP_011621140.1 MAP3K epsilon protein kinase 1 isoform X1 [Amborella trichopoda]